jgi:hypothetical protein
VKFFPLILIFIVSTASAQLPVNEREFLDRITTTDTLPSKLLSSKSVVFYTYNISQKDLEAVQKSFQRTGIDAVMYFESDLLHAGRDASVAVAGALNRREISNLILLLKDQDGYSIYITPYNRRANFVEDKQGAWIFEHHALDFMLQNLYRTASNTLRNQNFLINESIETGFAVNAIDGNRNEFFAVDLKVDPLAVPKFGDEALDKELEEIMKLYPYKCTFTDPELSEAELRKQGYLYVLRFTHARNRVVRNVLGYDIPRGQSAIVSVAYVNDQQQIRNIPANEVVYKYYFKHIDSQNVFLGTKWDADPTWQQALLNQLKGYRMEFKLN